MAKAIVDVQAMTSYLRENLVPLDACVSTVSSNIELFNLHVKETKHWLVVKGKERDDLIINLFKESTTATNKKFVRHMNKKKDECDEGGNINDKQLIMLVLKKHINLNQSGE